VYFQHLGGLTEGGDVQVAGRVIGRIASIASVPRPLAPEGHPLHPEGGVAVHLELEEAYDYMTALNAEVFISTRGVFGNKYIEMGPPANDAPRERRLRAGDKLRGIDPPQLDRVLIRTYRNLEIARDFLRAVSPEWDELSAAIDQLSATLRGFEVMPAAVAAGESLERLGAEARTLRDIAADTGLEVEDLSRVMAEARVTIVRMETTVVDVRARIRVLIDELARLQARIPDDAVARFEAALNAADERLGKVQGIVAKAGDIIGRVRRGEGTVGAIWNDPEFPEQAKNLGRLIKRNPWRLIGRPREGRSDTPEPEAGP
jgi:ABC-type transporter Mla subunit MlaD